MCEILLYIRPPPVFGSKKKYVSRYFSLFFIYFFNLISNKAHLHSCQICAPKYNTLLEICSPVIWRTCSLVAWLTLSPVTWPSKLFHWNLTNRFTVARPIYLPLTGPTYSLVIWLPYTSKKQIRFGKNVIRWS